jgi:hypothetical protein
MITFLHDCNGQDLQLVKGMGASTFSLPSALLITISSFMPYDLCSWKSAINLFYVGVGDLTFKQRPN